MSEKNSVFKRILNSAVIKNPLLFEAVGLCPVVAVTLSLRLAVFLAVVTAIELIVCEILAALFLKNVRRYWRVLLYVFFSIGVIFLVMLITNRFFPDMSINFGVYLPLMAVNSLVALHCERVAVKNNVKNSIIDAVSASMSYGLVAIVTGLLREIFASGSIGGKSLGLGITFPALLTPFGGFLIIGFLAAALKAIINKKFPNASPDRAFDTSEITRSVRGTWRELMKDDLDPYSFGTEDAFTRIRKEKKAKRNIEKTEDVKEEKAKDEKEHKIKKEKVLKPKKAKNAAETTKREPRVRQNSERTYLDDFSDMLSELEEYKNRPTETVLEEEKDGDEE